MSFLPTLNAALNATSALLLLAGYLSVRRGNRRGHVTCMVTALVASAAFLASYLFYHYQVGSVRFQGEGPVRLLYFAILVSHTVLAALVPPMAVVVVYRAVRRQFDRHRRVARWALPVWLYVSLTGVVVYLMLYVWFPGSGAGLSV